MSRAKASRWHSGERERRAVRRAGAEQERCLSEQVESARSGWIFRTNKGLGSRLAPKEQGAGGWRLEAVGTNERGEQDRTAVWAGAGAGAGIAAAGAGRSVGQAGARGSRSAGEQERVVSRSIVYFYRPVSEEWIFAIPMLHDTRRCLADTQ
ncbi:hypothetical protein B0H14DRAFT_3130144 [Mycena olivaceomarginata]|nr:hypothetical protein B0H14DRAFT_3130144 [Mycena olivaceomarginata]